MPTRRWAAARGIPGRSRCLRWRGRSGGPGLGAQRMRPSACGAFRPATVTSQRVSACHHRAAAADRRRCIAIRFDPLLRQTGFVPVGWRDCGDALQQRCVLREYTIQTVLGRGGTGIVYKARHKEPDQVVTSKEYLPSEHAVREGVTVPAKGADYEACVRRHPAALREGARAMIDFQRNPSIGDYCDSLRAGATACLVISSWDAWSRSRRPKYSGCARPQDRPAWHPTTACVFLYVAYLTRPTTFQYNPSLSREDRT